MDYFHFVAQLTSFIEKIAMIGGYPFLFFTVALEGVPLLGTLVPGHVSIVIAGFLIKIGVFNVWITCLIAIVAATLGDYIGFALGKKYGLSLIDKLRPFFFIKDEHITKVQQLVDRHTGKALILGRLSPITRALMPFVVGSNNVESKKFWFYNILGGTIWALGSIFLGYIFGAGYQAVAGVTGKFIFIVMAISLIIIWGYRFVNIRFHVFKKYELFALITNVLSLWGLARVIQDTWIADSAMVSFDAVISMLAESHMTQYVATVANYISTIGGTVSLCLAGAIFGAYFLWKGKWRSAIIFLTSIGMTSLFVSFMKEFFMRSRPENSLMILSDPSFPSGHAAISAAFFVVIIYLFMPKIHSWIKRELFFVVCVLAFILIGVSRIVLNVHWASDVLAGWTLGIFVSTASILFVKYVGGVIHRKIAEEV